MIFDGDCRFCRAWIERWRQATGQAGEYMPMETKAGQSTQTIQTPNDRLDFQTATVDPSDDRTVWLISEFADKADSGETGDAYRAVVPKVTP